MIYVQRTLSYTDRDGERRRVGEADLAGLPTPLVVLGEPGMGKSELLASYARAIGGVVVTAKALLRKRPAELEDPPGGVLVIDALDELASATAENPTHQVLSLLGEANRPPFVLSCRSADWQGALAKRDIAEDYGRSPLQLQLDPLTSEQAEAILSGRLEDPVRGREALEAFEGRGMGALAGNPLTLRLIADLAAGPGSLPQTRAELYEGACDLLWQERDLVRQKAPLANLTGDVALDAAGAAFAALLVTGKEAVSLNVPGVVSPDDLHVAEIRRLPGGAVIDTVLGSQLFRRAGEDDRFTPLHRTIAEFLSARWLARVGAHISARRLLGLLTYSGGVPASLRGVHAWLAHFSVTLAPDVIHTDPYGLLLYGDADNLSVEQGRQLLWALKRLESQNPYFRSEDWSRQQARGLTHPDLADDLRALLEDPTTGHQLRGLLLEIVKGTPVVAPLADDLFSMVVDDGPDARTYGERVAAVEALIALDDPRRDWPAVVADLTHRTTSNAHRLAIDIIMTVGPATFADAAIVEAALSYMGLLPGVAGPSDVDTIGPLYYLARRVPEDRIGEVLAAFAPYALPEDRLPWSVQYAYNDLLSTLIARALAFEPPDPLTLLAWLRLTPGRGRHNGEQRQAIRAYLKEHIEVRRAIQEQVLLRDTGPGDAWSRAWGLQDIDAALVPDPDDVAALLRSPHLGPLSDADARKTWMDLVHLGAQRGGLADVVSEEAGKAAAGDAELETFLETRRNPPVPDWEKKQRARDAAEAKRKAKAWAKHREDFAAHVDDIRAGALGYILSLSQAYFGQFYDMDTAATPSERIADWLGRDLLAAAQEGFEAVLHRSDLPGSRAIADSYGHSRRWNFMTPILAGVAERARNGRSLDDLDRDVVLSAALGLDNEPVDEKHGGETMRAAIDAWLNARPAEFEVYARLLAEPQLTKPRDNHHVSGLYRLVRQEGAQDITLRLAEEWLRAFPDMPDQAELELLDHLIKHQAWPPLRALAEERRQRGYVDDEHRLTWLTVDFLTDFETHRAALTAEAAASPALFWHIRNRGGAARGLAEAPGAKLDRLAWFFRTFRAVFPDRGRPSGSTSGNTNSWDAAEAMRGTLNGIASETSPAAIALLTRLRDEAEDSYVPHIRYALAGQSRARREAEFAPPTLGDLTAVLQQGPPKTPQDLKAAVLDLLDVFQDEVRRDDVNSVLLFWDHDTPWNETRCRDILTTLLRPRLPFEIAWTPERLMPRERRADLALERGGLQLPIEAKGQWNPGLWTAASDQLDTHYTTEHRAQGVGLYLVFWFGPDVPVGRRLKGPPKPAPRPTTPEALREALVATVPESRRGDVAVVVLDLSR